MEVDKKLASGEEQRPPADHRVRLGLHHHVQGAVCDSLVGAVHAVPARRHPGPGEGQGLTCSRPRRRRARRSARARQNPTHPRHGRPGLDPRRARRGQPAVDRPPALRRPDAAGAASPRPTASTTRCGLRARHRLSIPTLPAERGGHRRKRRLAGVEVRVAGQPLDPDAARTLLRGPGRGQPALPDAFLLRISDPGLEHVDSNPLEVGAEVEIRSRARRAAADAR